MAQYWNYAKGKIRRDGKGYATNRMPLWVKPNRKVDVLEVMDFMRDHLEGTELDMSKDPGAGPYECPYRWRPMSFEVDGKEYVHERPQPPSKPVLPLYHKAAVGCRMQ